MVEITGEVAGIQITVQHVPGVIGPNGPTITGEVGDRVQGLLAKTLVEHAVMSGAAVRFLRRFVRMRGQDLADFLDVRVATVSAWETNKNPIPRGSWFALAWRVAHRVQRQHGLSVDLEAAVASVGSAPPAQILVDGRPTKTPRTGVGLASARGV